MINGYQLNCTAGFNLYENLLLGVSKVPLFINLSTFPWLVSWPADEMSSYSLIRKEFHIAAIYLIHASYTQCGDSQRACGFVVHEGAAPEIIELGVAFKILWSQFCHFILL